MNIPNFPISEAIKKDGEQFVLHPEWVGVFRELFIALQKNLSNEGFMVPKQNTTNIAKINAAAEKPVGALIYDSQTHQLKVNINGEFKTVTTS